METETSKRKTALLTKDELKALKALRKTFITDVEWAESFRIDRVTLGRVLLIGRGSPRIIDTIREVLKGEEVKTDGKNTAA